MISFHSVKFRLTLWYTFILSVFLLIFAIFMHVELSRVLYRDTDFVLENEAKNIEDSLQRELSAVLQGQKIKPESQLLSSSLYFDPKVQLKLSRALEKWEDLSKKVSRSRMMIRFLGLDHKPLIMNLKRWEEEVIFPDFEHDSSFLEHGESFQTIHFRRSPVRLYYKLVREKNVPLFVIQCGVSLQEVQSTLKRLTFIISISIPIAMALAFMAGWFMAKRSFRPLDRMIRTARKITGPDIQGRLPRTQSGDELDRLAETLNEMMDRIEASKKAVQEFSSDVSHELRTPLAIIRGEIDLALRKVRTADEHTKTLKVIEGEVNELIRLVDDLIFLVRNDAKQLRFEKIEVSISDIVANVCERFKDRAAQKNIGIHSDIDPGIFVLGDTVYLKRILNNLIDNAIKFTPESGFVYVKLRRLQNQTEIIVRDTGMGIEPEKIQKLFSRFYRTDSARQYEGSGLGLNIAKAICDAHHGKIQIESQLKLGTSVTVTLPTV